MAEQHPSMIAYAISINNDLRNRITATCKSVWWNDIAADPTQAIPLDDLAWAVACNPTTYQTVVDHLEDSNISAAVNYITESDLRFVVVQSLARLDALNEPEPEPEPGPEETP